VVAAPIDAPSSQLEMTCVGGGIYILGAGDARAAAAPPVKRPLAKAASPTEDTSLASDLGAMTRALQRLHLLAKNKAALECLRVFRLMSKDTFRGTLADAAQEDSDTFAEALESAARFFTKAQQEKITDLTGLSISAEALRQDGMADEPDFQSTGGGEEESMDDVAQQLAELQEEIDDPRKGIQAAKKRRAGLAVKEEDTGGDAHLVRQRPDLSGKAAPETPAAIAARQWAARRNGAAGGASAWQGNHQAASWSAKGGGKSGYGYKGGKGGKMPRPQRSLGIVSVEGSNRLHKNAHPTPGGQPAGLMLKKGMPTVAPMCPAPQSMDEEEEEL